MAFEGNKTRHFSSLCFSFYTTGNHRRIKGCLIGFFVKELRSSQQYRKTELGLEEISCLSPFQLPNSPHCCPIQCCQLYSKCVPLQRRPTRPQAPSWELWDTLQSWQVATAVIGIILKVTYETPSAHQMQQYEQLKSDTHSPYWLLLFCFLRLQSGEKERDIVCRRIRGFSSKNTGNLEKVWFAYPLCWPLSTALKNVLRLLIKPADEWSAARNKREGWHNGINSARGEEVLTCTVYRSTSEEENRAVWRMGRNNFRTAWHYLAVASLSNTTGISVGKKKIRLWRTLLHVFIKQTPVCIVDIFKCHCSHSHYCHCSNNYYLILKLFHSISLEFFESNFHTPTPTPQKKWGDSQLFAYCVLT